MFVVESGVVYACYSVCVVVGGVVSVRGSEWCGVRVIYVFGSEWCGICVW